jgi:hypothetical protein
MCTTGGPKILLDSEPPAPVPPTAPAASQTTPEGAPVRLAPSQPAQGLSHCKEQSTVPPCPVAGGRLPSSPHLRGSFVTALGTKVATYG